MKTRGSKRAFTLTELLVVMSVVIILMSMLVVGIDGIFTYAVRMQCQHHMEQIWQACLMYQNQNKILPFVWDTATNAPWYDVLLAGGYVDDRSVLGCPSSDIVSDYGGGGTLVTVDEVVASNPKTVDDTLRWLADKQNKTTGAWDNIDGSSASNQTRTALCILAFLGAGKNEEDPEFGSTVRLAVEWLSSSAAQQASGHYGLRNYTNGMCLMAMSDSSVFLQDSTLKNMARSAAQKILNYLLGQQPATGGFTYESGGNDMSVSGWCYQGMAQAIKAGLTISQADLDKIYGLGAWMERVVHADGSSTYGDTDPNGGSKERLTQAAFGARLLLGPPEGVYAVRWGRFNKYQAFFILDRNRSTGGAPFTPESDPTDYDHIQYTRNGDQLYALYYLTVAMYLVGDKPAWPGQEEIPINFWSEWKASYIPTLLDTTPGINHGKGRIFIEGDPGTTDDDMSYWPTAADVGYGGAWGRTISTALAALSLGVDVGQSTPGSKWFSLDDGAHSYGYNQQISDLRNGRRTPAGDTIILMDYTSWAISIIGIDPDTLDDIPPRHGGKVNVLFGDGHVRAMTIDELKDPAGENQINPHMLSIQPGSDLGEPEEVPPEP